MSMNLSLVDKDEVPDSGGCDENVGLEGRESGLHNMRLPGLDYQKLLLGVTMHAGDDEEASSSTPAAGEEKLGVAR